MEDLINIEAADRLNEMHRTAVQDILKSDDNQELKDIKIRQLVMAERNLLNAMVKLMDKYISAREGAIAAEPSEDLDDMLRDAGITHVG